MRRGRHVTIYQLLTITGILNLFKIHLSNKWSDGYNVHEEIGVLFIHQKYLFTRMEIKLTLSENEKISLIFATNDKKIHS